MTISATQPQVLIIHGPNLNMLGKREPGVYGSDTIDDINKNLLLRSRELGVIIEIFQSNHEGEIVEKIQSALGDFHGLVINPAAYTHTSVAVHDALRLLSVPVIEVHLSNIYKREPFRHISLIAPAVTGQISGLGSMGYTLALEAVANMIATKK